MPPRKPFQDVTRLHADPPDGDFRGRVREISAGDFALTLRCPRCNESVMLGLHLGPRLVAEGQVGKISARAKSKPVEHICGQMMLAAAAPDAPELFPPVPTGGPQPAGDPDHTGSDDG